MENTAIVGILKWLFPSLVGSLLAVYNKSKEYGFKSVSRKEKVQLILFAILCVAFSVFITYFLGGAANEYLGFAATSFYYQCVYFVFGLSGLKIVDVFFKNIDNWMTQLSIVVSSAIKKLTDKWG